MTAQGIAPDLQEIKSLWDIKVAEVLQEATLTLPETSWMQSGGKQGRHSEHLGFLLAEMQHIQRTYPGNVW
jgi:ring-1,2-phenylacetyl-CoA epoxidase subunit PaaC